MTARDRNRALMRQPHGDEMTVLTDFFNKPISIFNVFFCNEVSALDALFCCFRLRRKERC